MGQNSKIEWTHHTFNAWRGCTKVSDGCKHCYAETMSGRNPRSLGVWGPNGARVVAAESYWKQPLKWNEAAAAAGERHRVFCLSLGDVFEGPETMPVNAVADVEKARSRLFRLIDVTPHLDWLLVTKRPENIPLFWPGAFDLSQGAGKRRNVWLIASVENQAAADKRIPELMKCSRVAAVLGLSMEPLLGPVVLPDEFLCPDFSEDDPRYTGRWVIVGGESGGHARPMHPDWARSIRDQCQSFDVAFFFKQWGEWSPLNCDGDIAQGGHGEGVDREFDGFSARRVGKKAAGRLLDAREWNEMPATAAAEVVA